MKTRILKSVFQRTEINLEPDKKNKSDVEIEINSHVFFLPLNLKFIYNVISMAFLLQVPCPKMQYGCRMWKVLYENDVVKFHQVKINLWPM